MSGSARRTTRQPASAAFEVREEARRSIVPATTGDVNSALDLDQRAALDVGEICTPLARRMEAIFAFEQGAAERLPVEQEPLFQPGWRFFVAEAQAHGLRGESTVAEANAVAALGAVAALWHWRGGDGMKVQSARGE